jgi:hypothetical protein
MNTNDTDLIFEAYSNSRQPRDYQLNGIVTVQGKTFMLDEQTGDEDNSWVVTDDSGEEYLFVPGTEDSYEAPQAVHQVTPEEAEEDEDDEDDDSEAEEDENEEAEEDDDSDAEEYENEEAEEDDEDEEDVSHNESRFVSEDDLINEAYYASKHKR